MSWPAVSENPRTSEITVELFENQREANLNSTVAMIEDVLIDLGHFVNDCRHADSPGAPAWTIEKGSAKVEITLLDTDGSWWLRVCARLLSLADHINRTALFEHLLSLNAREITGAAFALQDDAVLLVAERTTTDLDRSEVRDIISRVRDGADRYDDELLSQFSSAPA